MLNTIYLLKNIYNNKVYVGQTWDTVKIRWQSGNGYVQCKKLHRAIKKYGKEAFYYEILTFCSTQEMADYWEIYFIAKYDSIKQGYNIREGGSYGKHSETSILLMKERKKINNNKGKKMPPRSKEHAKKLGEANKGKEVSLETRQKLSIAAQKRAETTDGYWKDKHLSDEHKQNISRSNTGKKVSSETRQLLSVGKLGIKNGSAKLNDNKVREIRILLKEHKLTQKQIGELYNVSQGRINEINLNKSWAHVK